MYDDKDETTKTQGERIMKYKTTGDRSSNEGRRIAEIMVDMKLRSRAKMADEKVNGRHHSDPEDTCEMTRCFQARFMSQEVALSSWKTVLSAFGRKPKEELKTGNRSHRAMALTSVMLT